MTADSLPGGFDRVSLKQKLFEMWDQDRDGHLKTFELLKLARATGFDGTEEEWSSEEYLRMCEEQGSSPAEGLSEANVMALLDDESDSGCYFTDQELFTMLHEACAGGSAASNAPAPSVSTASEAASLTRAALKQRLFVMWDKDGDGFLNGPESFAVAKCTGWDESLEEWLKEYPFVCQEHSCSPDKGLSETAVMAMLEVELEDGCQYSEQELRSMLGETTLAANSEDIEMVDASSPKSNTAHSPAAAEAEAELNSRKAVAAKLDREALKRRLFRLWDQDKDGALKVDEMLQLALVSGFDGSPEEWRKEYLELCKEHKVVPTAGFPKNVVLKLLDGDTFLSTEDIQKFVEGLLSGGQYDPEVEKEFEVKVVRDDAGTAGFTIRQVDLVVTSVENSKDLIPMIVGDVVVAVNKTPVANFAEYTALAHKANEFSLTVKRPKAFQDSDVWAGAKPGYAFKKGEYGLGYYRDYYNGTFGVMAGFQEFFPSPTFEGAWPGHVFKKGHLGLGYYVDLLSRKFTTTKLFELCDMDHDGRLNTSEACQFARDNGFTGTWEEWVKAFEKMCAARSCDPKEGLSATAFADMLDDKTELGCYLTTEAIQEMTERIKKAQASSKERAEIAEKAGAPQKLEEIPIARLKALAKLHSVSLVGCLERSEIVSALKKAGITDQGAAAVAKAAEKQMDLASGDDAAARGAFAKQIHLCDDQGALKKDDVVKMAACVGWVGEDDEWFKAFSTVFENQGLTGKKEISVAQAMTCAEVAKARLLDEGTGEADSGEPPKKKPKVLPAGSAGLNVGIGPKPPEEKKVPVIKAKNCQGCEKPTEAILFCNNCKAWLCAACDVENHSTKFLQRHQRVYLPGKKPQPVKKVKELSTMSVGELKALAKEKVVNITACVEKQEIIAALEKAGIKPPEEETKEEPKAEASKGDPKLITPKAAAEAKPGEIRPAPVDPRKAEAERLHNLFVEHHETFAPGSQWELKTGVALWRYDVGFERTFYLNAVGPRGFPTVIEVLEWGQRRLKVRTMGIDRATGTLVGQKWQMGWLEVGMLFNKATGEMLCHPNTQTGQLVTPQPKAKAGTGVRVMPKAKAGAASKDGKEGEGQSEGGPDKVEVKSSEY